MAATNLYGMGFDVPDSAFTFDKVYKSRKEMDDNARTDNVFINRYVLVEYGETPIQGYYIDGLFYEDPYKERLIEPTYFNTYQDISPEPVNQYVFYIWSQNKYIQSTNSEYTYEHNMMVDKEAYGQNYDSTIWMKTYDEMYNKVLYTQIAELNAKTPNLYLQAHLPGHYTDLYIQQMGNDYYVHYPSNWIYAIGTSFMLGEKDVPNILFSDVIVSQRKGKLEMINGVEIFKEAREPDKYYSKIFYNQQGMLRRDISCISKQENFIGFRLASSGKTYIDGWGNKIIGQDTLALEVNLPIIGDLISEVRDIVFGVKKSGPRKGEEWLAPDPNNKDTLMYQPYDLQVGDTRYMSIRTLSTTAAYDLAPKWRYLKETLDPSYEVSKIIGTRQDGIPYGLTGPNNEIYATQDGRYHYIARTVDFIQKPYRDIPYAERYYKDEIDENLFIQQEEKVEIPDRVYYERQVVYRDVKPVFKSGAGGGTLGIIQSATEIKDLIESNYFYDEETVKGCINLFKKYYSDIKYFNNIWRNYFIPASQLRIPDYPSLFRYNPDTGEILFVAPGETIIFDGTYTLDMQTRDAIGRWRQVPEYQGFHLFPEHLRVAVYNNDPDITAVLNTITPSIVHLGYYTRFTITRSYNGDSIERVYEFEPESLPVYTPPATE